MKNYYKVVWSEGMNVDPHHWQQSDRFMLSNLNFAINSVASYPWGLQQCKIDKDALRNGKFSLLNCRGIMPDGIPIDLPEMDSLPSIRNLQDSFPATEPKQIAYLAIPADIPGEKNCATEGRATGTATRFFSEEKTFTDENTGQDSRKVNIAHCHFQIRFITDKLENFTILPIAEIVRNTDSSFSLNEQFIPPCLNISASGRLMELINGLLESMVAKAAELGEAVRAMVSRQANITGSNLSTTLLYHTLNGHIPLFIHCQAIALVHPETLYKQLLNLAGQLATISRTEISFKEWPAYEHGNLTYCFHEMNKIIRDLLTGVTPKRDYERIALQQQGESMWIGRITDPALLENNALVLIFKGEVTGRNLAVDLVKGIKIAAQEDMANLDQYALPGLPAFYMPAPPINLPNQSDLNYLRIGKSGRLWEGICTYKTIAIRVSPIFKQLKIELIAVRENR